MTDSFEKWILPMPEEEFEDRLESDSEDGGFTDTQREIALRIRTPLSEREQEDYVKEQEYIPRRSAVREIIRDVQKGQGVVIEIPQERGAPITIRQRITMAREPPQAKAPTGITAGSQKPSFRQRIAGAFGRFFRRRKP